MITLGISLGEKTVTIGEAVYATDTLINVGGRKKMLFLENCNDFSECYIELSIGPTSLGIKTDLSMNVHKSIVVNILRVKTTSVYVN